MLAPRGALPSLALVLFVLTGIGSTGCSMTQIAAGSTVTIIGKAWPAIERYEDIYLAEEAIPASIATMDGILELRPDDTELRLKLAQAYGSYGFGFLEDHLEEALFNDDEKGSEHYQKRTAAAYRRGRELALGSLTIFEDEGGGAEAQIKKGLPAWTEYLKNFDDAEAHVPTMFWAAYCWGRYIGINRDDVNALADLPFVAALSDRLLAIDHTFYGYAPHALRAGLIGTAPAQLGGKPAEAKKEFEVAIAATQGKNLMYLVVEAQIVAVALQDRKLYQRLLTTVLEAPVDLDVNQRLLNQLAKHRAERYLAQIDKLFEPEAPASADESAPATAPAASPVVPATPATPATSPAAPAAAPRPAKP